MAFGFLEKVSPEYVLGKAFLDIKKSGIDGLKPYLTDEVKKSRNYYRRNVSVFHRW